MDKETMGKMSAAERERAFLEAFQQLADRFHVHVRITLRQESHGEMLQILPIMSVTALPIPEEQPQE